MRLLSLLEGLRVVRKAFVHQLVGDSVVQIDVGVEVTQEKESVAYSHEYHHAFGGCDVAHDCDAFDESCDGALHFDFGHPRDAACHRARAEHQRCRLQATVATRGAYCGKSLISASFLY